MDEIVDILVEVQREDGIFTLGEHQGTAGD